MDDWSADLEALVELLTERHPCPWRTVGKDEFDARVERARGQVAAGPPAARMAVLAGVVAALGDGHTRLTFDGRPLSTAPNHAVPDLPIEFALLGDGLLVTAVSPDAAGLLGGHVELIGETSVAVVIERCRPVVSGENAWRTRALAPELLRQPPALKGLGLQEGDGLDVTVSQGSEQVRARVAPGPSDGLLRLPTDRAPGLARGQANAACLQVAPGVTLLKYDSVRDQPGRPLAGVFAEALDRVVAGDVLIIDLRHNSGGDNRLTWPLVHGLAAMPGLRSADRLFAIIGERTFSAAMNAVVALERHTPVRFVGAPTGAAPNHFGDAESHVLPRTGVAVDISTLWWQESLPYDDRVSVEPHLAVQVTVADYLAQRDPCVEAVLALDGADRPEARP